MQLLDLKAQICWMILVKIDFGSMKIIAWCLVILCFCGSSVSAQTAATDSEIRQILQETLSQEEYQPRSTESNFTAKMKAYFAHKIRVWKDHFRKFLLSLPTPDITMPASLIVFLSGAGTVFINIFYGTISLILLLGVYVVVKYLVRFVVRFLIKHFSVTQNSIELSSGEQKSGLVFPQVTEDLSGLIALHQFCRQILLKEQESPPSTTDRELLTSIPTSSTAATLFQSLIMQYETSIYRQSGLDKAKLSDIFIKSRQYFGQKA